ncbi:MAG: hypothetical protein LBI49_26015 [Nocardiopsaceae bacterium]|jgi:hypothetical protein|nr:hypothetical protein [Nocardiopsaceae bacterium]
MDRSDNSQALTAAQRIKDEIGLDVLDDAAVGRVLEVCKARRVRAWRLAVISGVLAAAIVIAWIVVGVIGQVNGFKLVLLPVLLIINGLRMVSGVKTARKMASLPRDIEAARTEAAAGSPAPQGAGRPPPDVARWN